jgi:putative aminopeptidase FrvX
VNKAREVDESGQLRLKNIGGFSYSKLRGAKVTAFDPIHCFFFFAFKD